MLASGSPQRREILNRLGLEFEWVAPEVEEVAVGDGRAVALENAQRKARKIAGADSGAVVIGCDTVVALGGRLLGKPPSEEAARRGLEALSGREHSVLSGVCVIRGGEERARVASTQVSFRELDRPLIDWYVGTGEWQERAGGYAIQGRGAALLNAIHGDYSSVVGLPLPELQDLIPDLLDWTTAEGV